MSLSSAIARCVPLTASIALHLGVASAIAGHPSAQRSGNDVIDLEVQTVETLAPKPEALAPEAPAEEKQNPSSAAFPIHHHDYPVAPSHDARPHDPSLVHTLAAPAPLAVPAPKVLDAPATEPTSFTFPKGTDDALASGNVATEGRPDGVSGRTGTAGELDGANHGDAAQPMIGPRYDVAYLKNAPPQYPAIARKLKLEGVATLRVFVSTEGRPQRVSLQRSSGVRILDEAALKAVQSWSFVPARRGNKPIGTEVDVPVRFRLNEF
jgi:protein TonB